MKGKGLFAVLIGWLLALTYVAVVIAAPTDAPRIGDVKLGQHESLFEFLADFGTSFEAQIFYALFGSGILGSLASYLWKWSQGTANGSHWTLRYVVGQLLWLAGISAAAVVAVGFETESGEFYGWLSVIWAGGFAGFSGEVKVKITDRRSIQGLSDPGGTPKP